MSVSSIASSNYISQLTNNVYSVWDFFFPFRRRWVRFRATPLAFSASWDRSGAESLAVRRERSCSHWTGWVWGQVCGVCAAGCCEDYHPSTAKTYRWLSSPHAKSTTAVSSSRQNGEDTCWKEPCKRREKEKAEAPSLSSWTLCLQAVLVSEGWHPSIPEQQEEEEEEDLERHGEKYRKKIDGRKWAKQEVC